MPDKIFDRRAVLRFCAAAGGCLAGGGAEFLFPPEALAQLKAKAVPRLHTVVLDAGHGGIDPGAIGLTGVYEKEIALDTTRLVARELEASKSLRRASATASS